MKFDGNEYTEKEIINLLRAYKSEINHLRKKIKEAKIINTDAMTENQFMTYIWNFPDWIESIYRIYEFYMKNTKDESEKLVVWVEYHAFFNFLRWMTDNEEISEIAFGKKDE